MNNNLSNIAKLVDYIENHLMDDLDLDKLSSQMGYSKYHLHRMFSNIVGFPIHFYVQRRKLTEAARLLIFSEQTIMDIALLAGYETQQSFTKAFRELFECSPRAFRDKRQYYPLQLKFNVDGNKSLRGDMMMDFRIVESDKILLIGYKANTANGFSVIGECWENLYRNKENIPDRIDKNISIALDDYTVDFDEHSQPAFDYYAAVEVSSFKNVPPGAVMRELPASKYVVFSFKGSPKDSMQPVVEYVYKEWFPQSTALFNDQARYDFAKLGEVLDSEGKGDVEFWVPIL